MINFKEVKTEDVISWIKDQAKLKNKSAILIDIDNTVACMLNVFLAKKTGLPVHAIVHNESIESFYVSRNFCEAVNIDYTRMDSKLPFENDWKPETLENNDKRIKYIHNKSLMDDLEKSARSYYISQSTNSLFCSNITKNDFAFIRNYPDLNPFNAFPFVNLSASEVELLFISLDKNQCYPIDVILKANESTKEREELEWLWQANERSKAGELVGPGIIDSYDDPTKHPKWFSYTLAQKKLIAKIYQVEKNTRYKIIGNISAFNPDILDE